ncbi:GINS2 [Bugula neritina]|uniref:GINS2 n=1 Tax=Bugula neritina TaxID=10212 RepID=A0A7J7J2Z2_BUGNE|nr:GINS2 [Bugula neritina]
MLIFIYSSDDCTKYFLVQPLSSNANGYTCCVLIMVNRLSPAEIEFLAEKQLVSITPKFTQNHIIYLISGNVGPFVSGLPTEVPLWLAINLRQRLKCEIVLPDWLSVGSLQAKKTSEAESVFSVVHLIVTIWKCPDSYLNLL